MASLFAVLPPQPLFLPDISRLSRLPKPSRPLLGSDTPRRTSSPPTTSGPRAATPDDARRDVPRRPSSPKTASAPRSADATPDDARRVRRDPKPTPVQCVCSGCRFPAASGASTTDPRTRPLEDREVAFCLLWRVWDASPDKKPSTLRCVCRELPQGSLCALHQDAPGRSWMERTGQVIPPVGGGGKVEVPSVRAGDSTMLSEYMRWRRNVQMPSRFYMEHARAIDACQKN